MNTQVVLQLYSATPGNIKNFLAHFYNTDNVNNEAKKWQLEFPNPIEVVDIIGAYIENIDNFEITMWISIDSGVFIKITQDNSNELIKYLYERFPY